LSFLPVIGAVFSARNTPSTAKADPARPRLPPAHDAPLQVRAVLCVWLGAAGLATVLLGPDLAARALGLPAIGTAALHFALGTAQERRLAAWLRGAITQGEPVYSVEQEAPKDDLPSLYADAARKATLLVATEDAGSYRRDPSRKP